MRLILGIGLLVLLLRGVGWGQSAPALRGDSWAQVQRQRGGVITVVWDELAPFAYRDSTGRLVGIEIELLESFGQFVRQHYGYDLRLRWVNGGSFERVYERVRTSPVPGLFGAACFSITPERQREVQFTPAYMPDLNVLVTHASAPDYASARDFIRALPKLKAYTMRNTTMAQDVDSLRRAFYPALPVEVVPNDYDVLERIAQNKGTFAYVPLSQYFYARRRMPNLKRQTVLLSERIGFAAIHPRHSDWNEPMWAFVRAPNAEENNDQVIQKYLGKRVVEVVFNAPERPSGYSFELLSLQKELVTQRLINTALEVQTQKTYQSLAIVGVVLTLLVAMVQYARSADKQRLNRVLTGQNEVIRQQKEEIERFNRKLEMKVLQAQMNPHFIFNSLNAIQYFVTLDEKRKSLAYIAAFARFVRHLLRNASQPYTPVGQEVTMLEQYLALEKMRFADKFSYQVTAGDDEALSDVRLPSLLVHPFVENALYHGILNRPDGGGLITVRFEASPAHLTVTVEDNGVGRQAAADLTGRKQGSDPTPHEQLVKDRIALLNEGTVAKITLETTDLRHPDGRAAGTRLVMHLPNGEAMD
ncbi:MAG: histidine kinase [Ferruginibacter sp.]|nr:histidine kinase [Cytophagales bacterium]